MPNRRKVLERIVQGFTVTGLGFFIYPFVKSWLPGLEEDITLEVSLADLEPGETKFVHWLGRRVIVRRQSQTMLASLTPTSQPLKDAQSEHSHQPRFATNAYRSLDPEVFVAFSNCTHLGCEVAITDADGIGFKCPCHQSDFDYAGRVLEGAAAPTNLEVPNYRFVSRNTLLLEPLDKDDGV